MRGNVSSGWDSFRNDARFSISHVGRGAWSEQHIDDVAKVLLVGEAIGGFRRMTVNPRPGGSQTLVRTLHPLPLSPAPVTVTVEKSRR